MATKFMRSLTALNAECQAVCELLDNGWLVIYGDTQAANANVAVTTQTTLAECRFSATAIANIDTGKATFATITGDASANASENATWFRCYKSDHTTGDNGTVVFDGSVGTSNCDLNLNSIAITAGGTVSITGFVYMANPGI